MRRRWGTDWRRRRTDWRGCGTDWRWWGTDWRGGSTDWRGCGTDWRWWGTDWRGGSTDWRRRRTDWRGGRTDWRRGGHGLTPPAHGLARGSHGLALMGHGLARGQHGLAPGGHGPATDCAPGPGISTHGDADAASNVSNSDNWDRAPLEEIVRDFGIDEIASMAYAVHRAKELLAKGDDPQKVEDFLHGYGLNVKEALAIEDLSPSR
eukprot:gene53638-30886_t